MPTDHITRVIRWGINTGISNESFLGVKAANIPNFGYELWPKNWANPKHAHDNRIFRQLRGQGLHLLFERSKRSGSSAKLRYSLLHK